MLKEKMKTDEEPGWNATRGPRSVRYVSVTRLIYSLSPCIQDGFKVHIPLGLNGGYGSFNVFIISAVSLKLLLLSAF